MRSALRKLCKKTSKILIENGVDVDAKDNNGDTAFHYAVRSFHKENQIFEYLTFLDKNGANPDSRNNFNRSPLMRAAEKGYNKIIEYLLSKGADINAGTIFRRTKLEPIFVERLKRLIPPGRYNYDAVIPSQTALTIAIHNYRVDTVSLLLSKGADITAEKGYQALHETIRIGKLQILRRIISAGIRIRPKEKNNYSHLMFASTKNNLPVIKLLIKSGADINAYTRNGDTPLSEALRSNKTKIAEYILRNKIITINLHNWQGFTPLMIAVLKDNYKLAYMLIEAGANLNLQSKNKENLKCTALIISIKNGNQKVASLLVKKGADATIPDAKNWTALKWAQFKMNKKIIRLLRKASRNK